MSSPLQMPQRLVRMYVAAALLSLVAAGSIFIVRFELEKYLYVTQRELLLFIALLGLVGLTLFLFLYLRGAVSISVIDRLVISDPGQTDDTRTTLVDMAEIRQALELEVQQLRAQQSEAIARLATLRPVTSEGSVDMNALIAGVRDHVTSTLASEIETRVEQRLLKDVVWRDTRSVFDSASARLQQEIGSLTRRANVNLLIGVATTVVAVGLLVYMVVGAVPPFTSWTELLSHYIPRLSTVIFIEVFSFFFLRLYRASLAEVKSYQNELTTLDSRRVALAASSISSDPKVILTVVTALAKAAQPASGIAPEVSAGVPEVKEISEIIERLAKIAVATSKNSKGAKDGDA